jgi:hypothetical protein
MGADTLKCGHDATCLYVVVNEESEAKYMLRNITTVISYIRYWFGRFIVMLRYSGRTELHYRCVEM